MMEYIRNAGNTPDCIVVGCGLSGMVIARKLAESGIRVQIVEKRGHIAGNLYDYVNDDGILVQQYGPHSFFTEHKEVRDYVEQFVSTTDFPLEYRTVIDGQVIPMPFNFKSIDILYPEDVARDLKQQLLQAFPGQEIVSVTDLVCHENPLIREYGTYMYEKEYSLYTAKQWGRSIESIEPSIFQRVPVYLSYRRPYQKHTYQFIPDGGFTAWAQRLLDHPNITVSLNDDALAHIVIDDAAGFIRWKGQDKVYPIVYTGALDALFSYQYGILPYRSLEFIWKKFLHSSVQETPVVAYPQAEKITRVTEYTKLPVQDVGNKSVVAIEIPFEYHPNAPMGNEPYYPVLTEETEMMYARYLDLSKNYSNLFLAGRLADYRYYNMDHVILRAQEVAEMLLKSWPF